MLEKFVPATRAYNKRVISNQVDAEEEVKKDRETTPVFDP